MTKQSTSHLPADTKNIRKPEILENLKQSNSLGSELTGITLHEKSNAKFKCWKNSSLSKIEDDVNTITSVALTGTSKKSSCQPQQRYPQRAT